MRLLATIFNANVPLLASTDVAWFRIQYDGTTLNVWSINNSTAPSESAWTAIASSPCLSGTDVVRGTGGQIGFGVMGGQAYANSVDDVTIKSYNESTSSFDTTELEEHFDVDGSGYASDTLAYDNNGNLTYDGSQAYTYDAWNRLKTTAHAYRAFTADGGDGNVHSGQVFCTVSYDAAGRRITKAVTGTGNLDCTYDYYHSGQSVIEERNGSDIPIKQYVWGLSYIDELVAQFVNSDSANPTGVFQAREKQWRGIGGSNYLH